MEHQLTLFSIDGVLLRSSRPLHRATETLKRLQNDNIPFILLTNGGGKPESERVSELSKILDVPLDPSMFVQSHTPFAKYVHKGHSDNGRGYKDKTILVLGGEGESCRKAAERQD